MFVTMPNLPMFSINTDRPGHSSTHACLGALLPPCVLSLLAAWKPALSGGSAACVVTLYCPPADREFIEGRRRALKRFINLVARHPPFSEDVLLKLFLSFSGSDVQHKLKEAAQCVGDEFMNCKLAARAKVVF